MDLALSGILVLALQASSFMVEAAPRLSQSLNGASTVWQERDLDLDSILASH